MNICLLKTIGKWLELLFISTISLFNFGSDKDFTLSNDVIEKNSFVEVEVIEHDTDYIYDASRPDNYEEVTVNGVDGVTYDNGIEEVVLSESVTEVITKGTGKNGLYQGMLTGYGPDCEGCTGVVACYTKEKTNHNLITDGIYYEDSEYGSIRILAADHREFPCGTIIEITNSDLEKEIGIVLDTGSGMRKAYDEGWILIDLAFTDESDLWHVTNKNTTFNVLRWGF